MYKIKTTNRFEKDFIKCISRKFDIQAIELVIEQLESSGKLPSKYKSHLLSGNFKGFWECHVKPDWLLIWHQNEKDKTIELVRTGTHADLFK
ncbi:MAG: type II toxin-antitoxin system YafQ family toxin [Prolixibacteraceae bacterium]|nr:type II toxin-antitoxin system YafQ family toxin [Prolixibacteraceae bacterium]